MAVNDMREAMAIAVAAHAGQTRFDGSDYYQHCHRVMGTVQAQGHSELTAIVAIMHDVVEDSSFTMADLGKKFSNEIINPLDLLTKREGEDYELYIQRLAVNERARAVKRADLFDNMDLTGLANPSRKRIENIEKYARSLTFLARFPQPRV